MPALCRAIAAPERHGMHRFPLPLAPAGALSFLVATTAAQGPLGDVNPTLGNNGSLAVYAGVVAQNVLYFPGNRWDTGTELWRSDGTVAGTRLVRDLTLGSSGLVQGLQTNGTLVFGVSSGQVVRSDGTEAGTYTVGSLGSSYAPIAVAGSGVVWQKDNGALDELWGSDGTNPTPVLLLSTQLVGDPVTSGNRAYFTAGDAANGWELWYTDGTVAGTVMLDLVVGPDSVHPGGLAPDGAGGVWFAGTLPSTGAELWHSDGTLAGTRLVADIGPGSSGSSPSEFCALGSRVFFRAQTASGVELWVSDGTAANTQQVLDIAPGNADSMPRGLFAAPALGRVLFSAYDPVAGREVWSSDGTPFGTWRLRDFNPGNANGNDGHDLYPGWHAGEVWFASTSPATGRELYRTDGTSAGTVLAADTAPLGLSSDPRVLGVVNGELLVSMYLPAIGVELWKVTPPSTAPALVAEFHPARPEGSFPVYINTPSVRSASLDGRQHFAAWVPGQGIEPWVSDGTPGGTTLVGQVVAGSAGHSRLLGATSTHVYYETLDSYGGANARLVAVGRSGPPVVLRSGVVLEAAVLRDRLVFAQLGGDVEPMITDGTVAGTQRLADVRPGPTTSSPVAFATMDDRVWFFADDGVVGRELWSTDGTAAGTVRSVDCVPGPVGLDPAWAIAGATRLFFRANGVLWTSDGTAAGTAQLVPQPYSFERVVLGDVLVLAAGRDLWRSDGTVAGTVVIAQSDSTNGEPIRHLCVARDAVFCSVERQNAGPQLWRSDGTAAGTGPVLTLHPSSVAAAPFIAPAGRGHVAIARTEPIHGTELWVSDGTVAGTTLVVDAQPGSAPSNPQLLVGDATANGRLTWWADTVATGLEPWAVPLAAFGGSDFDHFGVGCPGSRGVPHVQGDGLPVLGSARFAWQLRQALPGSVALLVLGFTRTPGAGACWLLNSGDVSLALPVDALGRAEYPLAVPTTAALAGFVVSGQFVVLDPLGAFGLAAASAGLEVLIGR